jgi:hypothetical protein
MKTGRHVRIVRKSTQSLPGVAGGSRRRRVPDQRHAEKYMDCGAGFPACAAKSLGAGWKVCTTITRRTS